MEPLFGKLHKWVRWLITFSFVNLAWVLFRSGSISVALQFYRKLFSFSYTGCCLEACRADGGVMELSGQTASSRVWERRDWQQVIRCSFFCCCLYFVRFFARDGMLMSVCARVRRLRRENVRGLAILFVLSVASFAGVTTFLYFNF